MKVMIDTAEALQALVHGHGDSLYYVDRESGEILRATHADLWDEGADDVAAQVALAPERYVEIEPLPAATVLGWMERFAAACDDAKARRQLQAALAGPAPGAAFRAVLAREDKARRAWGERQAAWMREHLVAWLAANGVVAELE